MEQKIFAFLQVEKILCIVFLWTDNTLLHLSCTKGEKNLKRCIDSFDSLLYQFVKMDVKIQKQNILPVMPLYASPALKVTCLHLCQCYVFGLYFSECQPGFFGCLATFH